MALPTHQNRQFSGLALALTLLAGCATDALPQAAPPPGGDVATPDASNSGGNADANNGGNNVDNGGNNTTGEDATTPPDTPLTDITLEDIADVTTEVGADVPPEGDADAAPPADVSCASPITLYADLDNDGYTGAAVTHCPEEPLPAGHSTTRRLASTVSFEALWVNSERLSDDTRRWEDIDRIFASDNNRAECDVRWDRPCDVLTVGDFGLGIPNDAEITGIALHFRWRANKDDAEGILVTTQLRTEGERVGTPITYAEVLPWPKEDDVEVTIGGPGELWGHEGWTAASLNTPEFGFDLELSKEDTGIGSSSMRLEIDYVWLEVFHDAADDCDDLNPLVHNTLTGYTDADGDGFGGEIVDHCVATLRPDTYMRVGGDCYDDNADAHPQASDAYEVDRGDGSFDYDCDDVETPEGDRIATRCSRNSQTGTCSVSSMEPETLAPCGQDNPGVRCTGCNLAEYTYPTRCR